MWQMMRDCPVCGKLYQEITMLDCFEEWNKYPLLDYWNAYVQKYFLF